MECAPKDSDAAPTQSESLSLTPPRKDDDAGNEKLATVVSLPNHNCVDDGKPTKQQLKRTTPLGLKEPNNKRKLVLLGLVVVLVVAGLAVGLGVGLSSSDEDDEATQVEEANFCGDGIVDDGVCDNGLCCSPYGYCGFSEAHCVNGQTAPPADVLYDPNRFCGDGIPGNGTCADSALCCSEEGKCESTYFACGYWPDGRDRGRPCGQGDIGDGECEDPEEECCSQWGWCGTTEHHCAPWNVEETEEDKEGGGTRALRGIV